MKGVTFAFVCLASLTCMAAAETALEAEKIAGKCEEYLPVWKLVSSPYNVHTFADDREMRADIYNVGGCMQYEQYATGTQFTGNYTLMGHHTESSVNDACLIRDNTLSSFQAVVIRSNGYKFDPKEIDLDDIDSLTRVAKGDEWREAMAIFGTDGANIVRPDVKRGDNTLLAEKSYRVTKEAMEEMGYKGEETFIPGGEYAAEKLYNCPFGQYNKNSGKCRLTASFSESVDSIAIIYAVTKKSRHDPNAATFFSELLVKCNCRCKLKENSNAVEYQPVPGAEGECTMTPVNRPSLVCDNLGDKMCYHDVSETWASSAESKLPNGNYKCALSASKITKFTSDYTPQASFLHRVGR